MMSAAAANWNFSEHIVIGGGPSGTSLTSTLIDHGHNVLIIERGDENDRSSSLSQVENKGCILPEHLSWTNRSYHSNFSIPQISIPQERLNLFQKIYPQGHGLGGTTNINAQIFTLGHPAIFDMFWPDNNWNAEHMSKYLDSLFLNTEYTTSTFKASGLFKRIIRSSYVFKYSKLAGATSTAGYDQCYPYRKHLYWDLKYRNLLGENGNDEEFTYLISAEPNGTAYDRRVTAADILKPKGNSPTKGKLTILRKFQVLRVLFDGLQAVGVVVKDSNCTGYCSYFEAGIKDISDSCRCGSLRTVNGGEVILSAGAFETPRILLASGFGEASKKIPDNNEKAANLPKIDAIGSNFQDHPVMAMVFFSNWWHRWDWTATNPTTGKAFAKYPVNSVHGWINLDGKGNVLENNRELPVVQLLLCDGRILPGLLEPMLLPRFQSSEVFRDFVRPLLVAVVNWIARLWLVRWLSGHLIVVVVSCVGPHSRGTVAVGTDGELLIDSNFFGDSRDLEAIRQGMFTARRLVHDAASEPGFWAMELLPRFVLNYDWTFNLFKDICTAPYFHACGTCSMQTTEATNTEADSTAQNKVGDSRRHFPARDGVVDTSLRVHGVSHLRIADASVIPRIPSGPTAATCMAIGVAAGRFIAEQHRFEQ